MNFSSDNTEPEMSFEINVISLVDVVFTLLLFFMATTTFSDSRGIDVNLPSTKTGNQEKNVTKELTVSLTKAGDVFLAGKKIDEQALEQEFQRAVAENQTATLVVRADQDVSHGHVVTVLDLARSKGLNKIAIATLPSK